jgi:diguanylate cyclase (GGDEF)-like protein
MTPGESYRSRLDWFVRAGSLAVACVGAAVIGGWLFNIALFKSLLPGLATMKANTAVAFLAAGASLWLLHAGEPGSRSFRLARALAVIVAALGAFTLAEDLFAVDFGIDEFILRDDPGLALGPHPGRMSPATALDMLLVGLALLCLKAPQPRLAACAHRIVAPALFIPTLALVGYAYGANSLYRIGPYTSIALHTALSLFVLALSVLAADTRHGFAKIATSDTAGGLVSRRLLPTIPFLLFGLGWLRLEGQRAGFYDLSFGLALVVLGSAAICVIALASTAITLHKTDVTPRQCAEARIKSLNVELEQRVQERTQQLDAANKALEQLSLQDGLTKLAYRRFFASHLAAQLALLRRHRRSLALVLCDIDGFKAYNDRYGHQAGDECLERVAAAIRSCCRRPADMAARYGGEEFAMILPETESVGAMAIAEAAREAVAQLKILNGGFPTAPCISISGGVAVLSGKIDATAPQLIKTADQALYEAKRLGRNRMICAKVEPEYEHS